MAFNIPNLVSPWWNVVGVAGIVFGCLAIGVASTQKTEFDKENSVIQAQSENLAIYRDIKVDLSATGATLMEVHGYCTVEHQSKQTIILCKNSDGSVTRSSLSGSYTVIAQQQEVPPVGN